MKRLFLSLVLLLCGAVAAFGRDHAMVSYNMDNGLSHNTVRCIAQDKHGFIWFGTADGLNRFDGTSFRVYDSKTTGHGLPNTSISALCTDRKGRLWVGTGQGVYIYDEAMERFRPFTKSTEFGVVVTGAVTGILENGDGRIWIGTEAQGFFIYHPESGALEQNSRLSDAVADLVRGSDLDVYVGIRNGTVAAFDGAGRETMRIPSADRSSRMRSLCYINDELWGCCATEGMARLSWSGAQSAAWTMLRCRLSVRELLPLARGELLVGADEGIFIYDTVRGTFDPVSDLSASDEPYTYMVNTLFRDHEGGIWVATQYSGVTYIPRRLKPVEHLTMESGGRSNRMLATCFAEDNAGNIWVAVAKRGVYRVRTDGRISPVPVHGGNESFARDMRSVQSMLADGDRLWLGTASGGVYAYDMKRGRVYNYRNNHGVGTSLCGNDVKDLFVDASGTVYAGTSWGFASYNPDRDDFVRVNKGGNALWVCDFAQSGSGAVWVLSPNRGAFLYDTASGSFVHHGFVGDNPKSVCIMEDSRGDTWLGSETGLYLLNRESGRFEMFDTVDNLLRGISVASLEEADNTLWIAGDNGLFCLNAEKTEVMYHLTTADGLMGNQFNTQASLRSRSGELYFSATSGTSVVRPEHLQRNSFMPNIYLTDLLINDHKAVIDRQGSGDSPLAKSLLATENVRLKHNQNTVGFAFAALSYQSSVKNRYMYRLTSGGNEGGWLYSDKNTVSFPNLTPGSYLFEVRGSNDDGVWSEKAARLAFEISPPFYRSAVAVLCYVLLFALLVWLGYRYVQGKHRSNMAAFASRQEEINYRSKVDFFTQVAHEIRTPLSLIKVPLEAIMRQENNFSPKTVEYLRIMGKNTDNLMDMINQLLDLRKLEESDYKLIFSRCNVSELVRQSCRCFGPALELGHIRMLQKIEPDVVALVDREAVSKIVNNMLSNVLKYAREQCSVTLVSDANLFRIMVSDDGPGIVPEDMDRIFETFYQSGNSKSGTGIGLPLARMLAVKHGGNVTCANSPSGGAVFTVEIPLQTGDAGQSATLAKGREADPMSGIAADEQEGDVCRILIVEDNDDFRTMIAEIVSAHYEIVTASNGNEALAVLADTNCDLIVSDVMMPVMDGYELCEYVKKELPYSHIPVILLTAKASLDDKVRGLEYGADAYIEKPFSSEHLMAQIESLLQNRERIRRALLADAEPDDETLGINQGDASFIERLNSLMEEHISEDSFYIEQLAEKMFMSRSNFYRKVKGLWGISPSNYMKRFRLHKAAEMMRRNDCRIKEIYEKVGFKSSSYFSSCFREEFGVTPKQYREQISEGEGGRSNE